MRNCAAELLTGRGEVLPLDAAPTGAGHLGFARRIPCGVVAAITPFNAPANLLVQKLAPALATGNAIVVKPHPTGIEVALVFAELAKKAGLPDGLFNVVTGDKDAALKLVAHPKVSVVSLRSEEHTSELQSQSNLVCRLLLEKKKIKTNTH